MSERHKGSTDSRAIQSQAQHTWSQSQIADTSSDVLSFRVIKMAIYNLHVKTCTVIHVLTSGFAKVLS